MPFLYTSRVIDRPATKETLAVALYAGIMDEVDAARKKLERFTAMDEGTVRPDTILERVNEFRQVRQKAAAYADLIGLQQESVISAVKALEERALAVVMKGDVMLDPECLATGTLALRSVGAQTPPPAAVEPAEPVIDRESESELLELLVT